MKLKLPFHKIKISLALSVALVNWLPLAFVTTAAFVAGYVFVQQDLRQTANDPQIQLAEDIAGAINAGNDPSAYAQGQKSEMVQSLAPFLIIYDDAGNPLTSSVNLSGQTPLVPVGVLNDVRKIGLKKVTWQPAKGVRSAIVVNRYATEKASGFVVVGRSLREVEARELNILKLTTAGLGVTLIGLFALLLVLEPLQRRLPVRHSHS